MQLSRHFIIVVLICSIASYGCAAKPTPVGSWGLSGSSSNPYASASSSTVYTFDSSGMVTVKQDTSYGPIALTWTYAGTYTLSGDKMTITLTTVSIAMDPATQQRMQQYMASRGMPAFPSTGPRTQPIHEAPKNYRWHLSSDGTKLDLEDDVADVSKGHLLELTKMALSQAPLVTHFGSTSGS